ncbi:hypothetical protein [Sulfolobus acidocaldarius]|nr:hypothetical protein [Sulfolobus acidocaldarius]
MNLIIFSNFLILVSGAIHIFRSNELTAFEISLLGSWDILSIGRMISLLIYVGFYAIIQLTFLYFILRDIQLLLEVLFFLLNYSVLLLLTSLVRNKTGATVLGLLVTILFPTASLNLVSNYEYIFRTKMDMAIGSISFYLNPMSYNPLVYPITLSQALTMSGVLDFLLTVIYLIVFRNTQIKT